MRYTPLIFVPLVLADVEFLSINLKGWQGCNNAQSAKISAAWENAVKMAAAVKDNVDLNEAASVEYFGPPAFSADYVDEIRGVFSNAATFSQGSKWTPTPLKWDAYVRCDNWKGNCNTRGVAAYNVNKMGTPEGKDAKSDDERERSTPVMNFCPMWFRLPSLTEKIALNQNEKIRLKYDLENYTSNRDSSLLHELMHADIITFKKNDKRHIWDMKFRIKAPVGENAWRKAYGPGYSKLYTRVEEVFGSGYTTTNADSFTIYALAKTVQKALGNKYPYLPRAYNEEIEDRNPDFNVPVPVHKDNDVLSWAPNTDGYFNVQEAPQDQACSAAEGETECPPGIEFSKLVDDSKYPQSYLDERKKWLEEIKTMTFDKLPDPPTSDALVPDNVSLKCNYDETFLNPAPPIDTSFAKDKIKDFCKLSRDITLDESKQPQVQMHYADGAVGLYPYVAWNAGDPRCVERGSGKIEEDHCLAMFDKVIAQCPSMRSDKTHGGAKVDNCLVFGFDIWWDYQINPATRRKRGLGKETKSKTNML